MPTSFFLKGSLGDTGSKVVAAVAGALAAFALQWAYGEVHGPPSDSTVTRLIEREAQAGEQHRGDIAMEIYAPNAVVADAACGGRSTTFWRGGTQIQQRYDALLELSSLRHIDPQVNWMPSDRSAERATATAHTAGIMSGTTLLTGHELWEFERIDGEWLITAFTYNICMPE